MVLREFDLASRDFVAGGFTLPEAKGGAAWLDRDTLLLSSALGEGMATSSGYARTVRLWRRGTDPLAAPVIFETDADHMAVWAEVDREVSRGAGGFVETIGFFDSVVWIRRPHRSPDPARCSDRRLGQLASRLARGQAADPVDDRR